MLEPVGLGAHVTEPGLSSLTFGTMRLDRAGGVVEVAALISAAVELGVTSFHTSTEYATWPLFVEAWRRVDPSPERVRFICKVGVPHFGEQSFSAAAFTDKVDLYRRELRRDRLDVVQWLLRYDLKQESRRLEIFDRDSPSISETVARLRQEERLGAVVSFPYSDGVAERAIEADWCDGLALYCNPLELEWTDWFDRAGAAGKHVVAIRPFAAGRLFSETDVTAEDAVAFPLQHPATATVVASFSSVDRLSTAARAASAVTARPTDWEASVRRMRRGSDV